MAFDKPTRNLLARFVADARDLIAEEFTQQFQSLYGISADGKLTPEDQLGHLDDVGLSVAKLLRERIDYLVKTHPDDKGGTSSAVSRLAREQAFTVLNRLAALRMAEKRDLIHESVGKGYQSKGFKVFEQVAGAGLGDTFNRYRRYLFCLFDEFAVDLGVLFDRSSPQGLLFPRETALLELLDLINAYDLENLWGEDETIGWVYQYYNDPEERKQMRKESGAPRNSRELAVRNQFFTPRYVVEFLTDNTLGRIWYEMTQGKTQLTEGCRYLVRRTNEIFLKEGEEAPVQQDQEGLSQEELLKQPVYIPYRPVKDPREIRLLDPACGSMHFGLYAFDLYEEIYAEAWDLDVGALRQEYPEKEALLCDAPRLVIENNIHGIDIDPRAAQIAGLSLWLRAQKSWKESDVKSTDRPRVLRSNIVCAEPMPGSKEMLREFTETLYPPLLGQLVETAFDKMELAGEAGSLLKIEEEIRFAIKEARELWAEIESRSPQLFSTEEMNRVMKPGSQQNISGLELAVSETRKSYKGDLDFFGQMEERIYAALREYADTADSNGYQRRLFAEDAAHGFAFIDLCRKHYDVVVMNPPFGEIAINTLSCLKEYESFSDNIAAPFAERALRNADFVAMVVDRALLIRKTHENFRLLFLDDLKSRLSASADYGWGVLDANVEVAGLVATDYDNRFSCSLNGINGAHDISWVENKGYKALPNNVIAGEIPSFVVNSFARFGALGDQVFSAKVGNQWKSERYLRLWWESTDFALYPAYNGGPYSTFELPTRCVTSVKCNNNELLEEKSTVIRNAPCHGRPGIGYGKRGVYLDAHILPAGQTFTVEGLACFPMTEMERWTLLSFLNTSVVSSILSFFCGQHKHVGYVNKLPFSKKWKLSESLIGEVAEVSNLKRHIQTIDETTLLFNGKICDNKENQTLSSMAINFRKKIDSINKRSADLMEKLNEAVSEWVGFPNDWREYPQIKQFLADEPQEMLDGLFDESGVGSDHWFVSRILGISIGHCFGQFDIRCSLSEYNTPELPHPFSALPDTPPGMLKGKEGGLANNTDIATDYPIKITWSGILVDDEGNQDDIATRIESSFRTVWGDKWESHEQEVCSILGVKELRDYLRKPSGFFADHLKRYSKSRRQAPIYWPLSTKSGGYTVWLYSHRLSDQTLHAVLADFIDPKLKNIRIEISSLRESGNQRSRLEELMDLEAEIIDMRNEIERIIKLNWQPNLKDGVLITASPLWQLFRQTKWQKDLKACWIKLEKGEYDWAHLAYSIWPERVEKKCAKDRSLALAHGLEHLCKVELPKKKSKKAKKTKTDSFEF